MVSATEAQLEKDKQHEVNRQQQRSALEDQKTIKPQHDEGDQHEASGCIDHVVGHIDGVAKAQLIIDEQVVDKAGGGVEYQDAEE